MVTSSLSCSENPARLLILFLPHAKSSPSDVCREGLLFVRLMFPCIWVLSECPFDGCAAAEAFAFALPAIEMEVIAYAAVLGREAVAEFEHIARSFERGAGRCVAADGCARFAQPLAQRIELYARTRLPLLAREQPRKL